jgi:NADPH:quinone reductase-like Zn-dependent oxidoreductase
MSGHAMQAVVQDEFGSADVLRVDTVPVPAPAPGEVLVEVHAAGVTRAVWHYMTGTPLIARTVFGFRTPKRRVVGLDLSGVVAELGSGVTAFQVGDEVHGIGIGAFAEYAIAPAAKLVAKPARLTHEQAAIVPISGITALQALRDSAQVVAGQHVLVVGASGGVGTFAVQVAKALGATVTGVCSAAKVDLVRDLGADHVVDYTREEVTDGDGRFDAILDCGGRTPVRRLRRILAPGGTLVIVGGEGGNRLTGGIGRQLVRSMFSRSVDMLISKELAADVEALDDLIARDEVTPSLGGVHELADAASAIAELEAGRVRGLLAVRVRASS